MRSIQSSMGAWLVVLSVLLAPAMAQAPKIYETITGEQLLELMKAEGFTAELNESGDILWRLDGRRAILDISDNQKGVLFGIALAETKATLEKVNQWNATKRFSRTYLDGDGDPVLELDLDLAGGVTEARVVDFLKTCQAFVPLWIDEVVR